MLVDRVIKTKRGEHNVRKIHKTNIRLNIKSNGINSINAINDNYWNISKNKPRKSYNIQTKKTREKRRSIQEHDIKGCAETN